MRSIFTIISKGFAEFRRLTNCRPENPKEAEQTGANQPSSTTSHENTNEEMQTLAIGRSHVANGISTPRFTTLAAGGASSSKGRRRKDHQVALSGILENPYAGEAGYRRG